MKSPTSKEIQQWAEENLFGRKEMAEVTGPAFVENVPLTPTQHAILILAVEIIGKWEAREQSSPSMRPMWEGCVRASSRLMDLVCAMYHPGDKKARKVAPTATWAEIIQEELLRK